jgi:hypothetical protein
VRRKDVRRVGDMPGPTVLRAGFLRHVMCYL